MTRLHVRLGATSVVLRSFHMCFGPATRGTICEGAVLDIEEVPLSVHCPHCAATRYPAGRFNFRCPDCGTPTNRALTGREMQLVGIDLAGGRATEAAAPEVAGDGPKIHLHPGGPVLVERDNLLRARGLPHQSRRRPLRCGQEALDDALQPGAFGPLHEDRGR